MSLRSDLLAGVLASGVALAAAQGPPPAVPEAVGRWILQGQGELRWLGLKIYDAALWVPAGSTWSAQAPFALALRYDRAISSTQLVDRTLEELTRLGYGDVALQRRWRGLLEKVLPAVVPGDTLVGLYQPGQGAMFWRGERLVGGVSDPELAQAFFSIWLDPRTREPTLRGQLLGAAG